MTLHGGAWAIEKLKVPAIKIKNKKLQNINNKNAPKNHKPNPKTWSLFQVSI